MFTQSAARAPTHYYELRERPEVPRARSYLHANPLLLLKQPQTHDDNEDF
jgi:hypothetical protein